MELPGRRRRGRPQRRFMDVVKVDMEMVGVKVEDAMDRQHRQLFRTFDWPFVLAQQFRDSCRRWLLSEECDSKEVLDLVVLEQFITRLPEETAAWAQCHQPESMDEATKLSEAHMAAYSGAGASTQQTSLSSLGALPTTAG
uniref:SCAN box domain-containing protein n=1 Tax=Pygocentrus nattereri TaxID=42514 RepID=A0AAR2L553_PYGNA